LPYPCSHPPPGRLGPDAPAARAIDGATRLINELGNDAERAAVTGLLAPLADREGAANAELAAEINGLLAELFPRVATSPKLEKRFGRAALLSPLYFKIMNGRSFPNYGDPFTPAEVKCIGKHALLTAAIMLIRMGDPLLKRTLFFELTRGVVTVEGANHGDVKGKAGRTLFGGDSPDMVWGRLGCPRDWWKPELAGYVGPYLGSDPLGNVFGQGLMLLRMATDLDAAVAAAAAGELGFEAEDCSAAAAAHAQKVSPEQRQAAMAFLGLDRPYTWRAADDRACAARVLDHFFDTVDAKMHADDKPRPDETVIDWVARVTSDAIEEGGSEGDAMSQSSSSEEEATQRYVTLSLSHSLSHSLTLTHTHTVAPSSTRAPRPSNSTATSSGASTNR
jgi:hypothetical protein